MQVGTLARGEVPRADVAAVLAAVLSTDSTIGKTFDLLAGHQTIEAALAGALSRLDRRGDGRGQPVTMLTSLGARTITLRTVLALQRTLHVRVGQRSRLQVGLGDVGA